MRLDRWISGLILIFIFFSIIVGLILVFRGAPQKAQVDDISGLLKPKFYTSKEGVGLVNVYGPIFVEPDSSPFSLEARGADSIVDTIENFIEDQNVKALLVRVNSPGGAMAASQEIYRALWRFRQTGRPVVISMGDLAASGGYYISSAANYIFANPGTVTGSIGVIFSISNFKDLMTKIGMKQEVIKSGEFKDIGSFARDMTEEEKKLIQNIIDNAYKQFLNDVAKGREKNPEDIKPFADGRILIGEQALEAGLVDALGDFNDALMKAGELAGIKGKPYIIEAKKKTLRQILDMLEFSNKTNPLDFLLAQKLPIMYMYQTLPIETAGYQKP